MHKHAFLWVIVITSWLEWTLLKLPFWKHGGLSTCAVTFQHSHKIADCFVDPWSVAHFQTGMVLFSLWHFALLLLYRQQKWTDVAFLALLSQVAWELTENQPWMIQQYKKFYPYFGDTILNSIGDQVSCLLGCAAAHLLNSWKRVLTVFLSLELALYVWIGECGTLTLWHAVA